MKRKILQIASLTGTLAIGITGGMVYANAKYERFLSATTVYAKDPNTGICICLRNAATTFCNLTTSISGLQAKITSKNSGRPYLLFEDATCATNPVYFR